jgi:hypothetical protein
MRDADALVTETDKLKKRNLWYSQLVKNITNKKIFILIIYELEAWIIADITTFNSVYKTNIKFNKNIQYLKDPKGHLIQKTRNNPKTYKESDAPELFKKLSFDKINNNCPVFKNFIKEFDKAISI